MQTVNDIDSVRLFAPLCANGCDRRVYIRIALDERIFRWISAALRQSPGVITNLFARAFRGYARLLDEAIWRDDWLTFEKETGSQLYSESPWFNPKWFPVAMEDAIARDFRSCTAERTKTGIVWTFDTAFPGEAYTSPDFTVRDLDAACSWVQTRQRFFRRAHLATIEA